MRTSPLELAIVESNAMRMRGLRGGTVPFNAFINNGPRAGVVRGPAVRGLRGGGLRGACGDMAAVGEVLTTDPRTRDLAGGLKLVPTVWVQRAVNALLSFTSVPGATRLTVDGVAGPNTLNAVKAIRLWDLSRQHPVPADDSYTAMPSIVDAEHIAMASHTHEAMNNVVRIADPVGSTVGLCSWTRAAALVHPSPLNLPTSTTTVIGPELDPVSVPDGGHSWMSSGTPSDGAISIAAFALALAVGLGASYVALRKKRGRR